MSNEAETSRLAAQKFPRRDLSIALGITNCCFAILIAFGSLGDVTAQETPPPGVTPSATPSVDISSTPSASPSGPSSAVPPTTPSASASPSPVARTVRISFVPPPLEGTISLGIYDKNEQLVRVLHQEAELDEFEVGADALNGRWDGKDDDGYDLPAGRYHAKGFVVAPTKVEEVKWDNPGQTEMPNSVRVKLVANPLENNERPIVELAVGFDDENAFLKAADGLPLITIWPGNDTTRAWITQRADKSLDVFLDYGVSTRQLHVMGVSKMMAFDCGDLDLK
jgi:hypothetical protein